jgi:hypothetical protein
MGNPTDAKVSWRHYSIRSPISACLIRQADLKRLYEIISEKQDEESAHWLGLLAKQPNETSEQFEQRKINVKIAFVTLVSVAGPNGETVTGNSSDIFDSSMLPERIQTILMNTANGPKALNILPNNWASLFLDFRRPPLLNLGVLPSAPTQNGSNYEIVANAEAWATALDTRLRQFFKERSTIRGWVHKAGCYDGLVLFVGLPLTLWVSYRLGPWFTTNLMPTALVTAIYVTMFFILLNLFRILFSYTRWVFPLVELQGPRSSSAQRHRGVLYIILSSVLVALIIDGVRFVLHG